MKNYTELLEIAIKASIEAGSKISEIYRKDFEVDYKKDHSPLTIADTKSNEVIMKYLAGTEIPVLSEEGKSIPYDVRKKWERFWIVDPLDGTKEFIKRNGEFTVNIALIRNKQPVLGVIYIPEQHALYYGSEEIGSFVVEKVETFPDSFGDLHESAQKLPLEPTDRPYTIVGSKSHLTPETQEFIDRLSAEKGKVKILSRGSSLKICMVAEGRADIYPRFAPTMEWDIAAGHAIARFAGVSIKHQQTGAELKYNSESLVNPWFIVERK